jgi:ketosteroid isomerase-like protein
MSNVEIMQGLYKSFAAGDMPTVLGAMTPDIEWRSAEGNPYRMSGEPFIGPDAILTNLFAKLGEEWAPLVVTPTKFHDAGNTVVVEGRYTGTYKATGRNCDAQFCHIWSLDSGRVKAFQQYVDTAQMQRVMGTAAE